MSGASAAAAKVPDLAAPCRRTVFFFEFCVSVFFFLFILSPFFFVVPPACQGRLILFIFPIPLNILSFFSPSPRKASFCLVALQNAITTDPHPILRVGTVSLFLRKDGA